MSQPFKGFRSPNYTQVPDELFDELLPELSGAELKALLYVIRRTFGFKKDSDNISLGQMLNGIVTSDGRRLDKGAGLSKPTLLKALRDLADRNIIIPTRQSSREKGNQPTNYRLNVIASDDRSTPGGPTSNGPGGGGQKRRPPLVKEFDQGGVKSFDQGLVKSFDHTRNSGQEPVDNTHGVRGVSSRNSPAREEAAALVAHFHERIGSVPGRAALPRELDQAAQLLAAHGTERARFIVGYAIEQAAETKFRMRHFGALEGYVSESLVAFETAEKNRRRREAEELKQREEDKQREAERAEWARLSPEDRIERRVQTNLITFRILKGRDPTDADVEELRQKFAEQEGIAPSEPARRAG